MEETRLADLIYTDEYGLLGSEYYWENRGKMNISMDELFSIGITDNRVRVHKDIIPALQEVDKEFQEREIRPYIKQGYRSPALYELAFRKRSEKYGEVETDLLMNIKDKPHITGKAVDIALWDPIEKVEIPTRNRKDDPDSLFIDFYKNKTDSESKRYQEMQDFIIATMTSNGFYTGKLREYFHFNYFPEDEY